MSKKVLVFAAHPDDEVLGCGGAIAAHVAAGDSVSVVLLGGGVMSRGLPDSGDLSATRRSLNAAALQANRLLGVVDLQMHDFPDNQLDTVARLELTKVIEGHIARVRPAVVYSHHCGDVNIDHRRIHEAVITAVRPVAGHSVKRVLFFEVPSSTEWQVPGSAPVFAPNVFIDITRTMELKLAALREYESEMRPWPHPRSLDGVTALARWRGATAGFDFAESFVLGRSLEHIG